MKRLLIPSISVLAMLTISGNALTADRVTFQLDWLPGGDKAPVYVGLQQGFFSAENLDVRIMNGRGSTDAITKMATGQSDIGSADIGALMAAKAQDDVPVSAIYSVFTQAPHAFFTLEGSGINSITDIAGKRVATSPFTSSNAFLPLVLHENNLTNDAITLTQADAGALGPMLMTGNTDAIIAWITNIALFESQAKEVGKNLTVLPWSEAGLELYSSSLLASDQFLNERADVAERFVKAYAKSVEFMHNNPDIAGQNIHTLVPEVNPQVATAQIYNTLPLIFNTTTEKDGKGVFTAERLSMTWEWVSKANNLPLDALDPATVINTSFSPKED